MGPILSSLPDDARTEDFGTESGTNSYTGVATTVWAGFILKPRDLFDGTPLYTPTRSSFSPLDSDEGRPLGAGSENNAPVDPVT